MREFTDFHALRALAVAFAFTAAATAAPLTRDLGQGLTFHRVHRLPADLPAARAGRPQPCVLDLRYVTASAEAALALGAWLEFHATARVPVFLLANSATSPALLAGSAGPLAPSGIVIIGPAGAGFQPALAVAIAPDVERRAYDALGDGAAIETLLVERPEKTRTDEASLVAERRAPPAPSDFGSDAPAPTPPATARPAPPLIDVALQRAVHLHRALVALKRIQP
ncbi:MAG: hypothetical protein RLZZ15_1989 [Verrucomicrobiota bacterium]|jgi:hypothetical protein